MKEQVVAERKYKNLRLEYEDMAEIPYQPAKCKQPYRLVMLRKMIKVKQGQTMLFPEIRYFFYITNDWSKSMEEIVFESNDRCNQENLIGQLKSGLHALRMPLDNLYSNWAYMIMATFARNLKAWLAMSYKADGRNRRLAAMKEKLLRMEFPTFLQAMIMIPAQIIKSGRRVVIRLLNINKWTELFLNFTNSCVILYDNEVQRNEAGIRTFR
ncbi:MAG: transposase [Planctomycetia bacterium]|nr:transposase [Planctomycetia bacterium]